VLKSIAKDAPRRCELYALCCLSYCNCRQNESAGALCTTTLQGCQRPRIRRTAQAHRRHAVLGRHDKRTWNGILGGKLDGHPASKRCGEQEVRNTRGGLFLRVFTARLTTPRSTHARYLGHACLGK